MNTSAWFTCLGVLLFVCASYSAADNAERRARTGQAYLCARTQTEPTDANLARCFTSRDLPVPEDLR